MEITGKIVTIFYYMFCASIAGVIIYNLWKSKEWKEEILYILVLIPFLLRLFMLK